MSVFDTVREAVSRADRTMQAEGIDAQITVELGHREWHHFVLGMQTMLVAPYGGKVDHSKPEEHGGLPDQYTQLTLNVGSGQHIVRRAP